MMKIPDRCPECNSELERINDQLYCRNAQCPAVGSKRLEHFCKVMKIKGLGPATIEELGFDEISDIYYFDTQDHFIDCLGSVRGPKVFESIQASKSTDIATFIEALSIPSISAGSARKLAEVVDDMSHITKDTATKAGIGNIATANLIKWLDLNLNEIRKLPIKFVKQMSNTAESKTVCITGKLQDYKNRTEAAAALNVAGYRVVDSITKTTDFLVNESGEVSSKTTKAEQYKIPVVSMKYLLGDN